MDKNKRLLITSVILSVFIIIMVGVTFAFFNYTRTGAMNNLSVGTVKFSHTTDTLIDVSNDIITYDLIKELKKKNEEE